MERRPRSRSGISPGDIERRSARQGDERVAAVATDDGLDADRTAAIQQVAEIHGCCCCVTGIAHGVVAGVAVDVADQRRAIREREGVVIAATVEVRTLSTADCESVDPRTTDEIINAREVQCSTARRVAATGSRSNGPSRIRTRDAVDRVCSRSSVQHVDTAEATRDYCSHTGEGRPREPVRRRTRQRVVHRLDRRGERQRVTRALP